MIRLMVFLLSITIVSFSSSQTATGYVYYDRNENGIMEDGEEGLSGVCVSNGIDVVQTDSDGKWKLPVSDDTGIFLIKPAKYSVPVNYEMVPQYFYLHKPNGSPPLEKEGVQPTGDLPNSINFPLVAENEPEKFSALFFGDTQASSPEEVNYINHDIVEELIGTNAKFGVTLGDIVGHDLDLFKGISEGISQIGIPWYYVFGNHDNNRDAKNNKTRDETFEKYFGPSNYAFEYGKVSFIAFNTVHFDSVGKYKPRFSSDQINFLENYLEFVPKNKLIVLMMHIPILRAENREQIFALLQDRPHTFSISGHVHDQLNFFVDKKFGWNGEKPHHHLINGTVCGSWWSGQIDEVGIPHATMNDGAPNGYSIVSFDGNKYSVRYKAARRSTDYQMNIYAPNKVSVSALDTTKILVNIFAGSEKSTVEMKIGNITDWQPLDKVEVIDPECLRMHKLTPIFKLKYNEDNLDEILGWTMDKPHISYHMWEGKLNSSLSPGVHTIYVRTTDMYGESDQAYRIMYVEE